MYQIHYTDGTGNKDLKHLSDVRMNIMLQHHNNNRVVEKVLLEDKDVTSMVFESLPINI